MNEQHLNYSPNELGELINTIRIGIKPSNDPIFDELNKLVKPFSKQGFLRFGSEEDLHLKNSIACNVLGCNKDFQTVFAYQGHYNANHRFNCDQCKKIFPTAHLLDIHISEKHDSFFAIQAERKPMYLCFVKECSHKSSTSVERKDHCIEVHNFPANYRFFESNSSSKCSDEKMDTGEINITQNYFNKTPKNFTFGHQKQKVFATQNSTSRNKVKNRKPKIDTNAMEVSIIEDSKIVSDLLDSLQD